MPYVQRQDGVVTGVYSAPQPYANEWLEDTDPSVLSFFTKEPAELDAAVLNAVLAAEGSVVRALALVLLQELNTVRTRLTTPLPAYTQAQLVSALKAKMR